MKYCRVCGTEIPDEKNTRFCKSCGCAPLNGNEYCQECGVKTRSNQVVCINCGVALNTADTGKVYRDWNNLDSYYQAIFTKIYESNEQYKGEFNIFAFLFGPFWAISKGLWLPVLVDVILGILTGGIVFIAYWFVFGIRGNYMYYCHHVKSQEILL